MITDDVGSILNVGREPEAPASFMLQENMALLPYYTLYPQDFDCDENVRLMEDCELGMFLRLLNHSWINDGLPADSDAVRRLFRYSKTDFEERWPAVSKCFEVSSDGRRRNTRQEQERSKAIEKTEKSKRAAKSRWDADAMPAHSGRNADAMPRAYDIESDIAIDKDHHQTSKSLGNKKLDDDDEKPKPTNPREMTEEHLDQLEPLECLKEIYRRKTRELPAVSLLQAIRDDLAVSGVSLATYVAEIRLKHTTGHWQNPPGLLRSISKEFRSKTVKSTAPLTPQEQADKDYQCPECKSRKRGEGLLMDGGKIRPCSCASLAYIQAQAAKGVIHASVS